MRKLAVLAATVLAAVAAYRRFLRVPVLTWGATRGEAAERLPGDELLEDADLVATRAVDVAAPPGSIWPWLLQLGPGRAGAYTYDWIENLFGLNMHSADEIHPELQQLEPGDLIGEGTSAALRVAILEPEQVLSMRSDDGTWVWTFVLRPQPDGSTRLLSRNRLLTDPSLGGRLGMAVMEPGSLVMERKMLLGIKQRAERLARVPA